jgi:plastocyanin
MHVSYQTICAVSTQLDRCVGAPITIDARILEVLRYVKRFTNKPRLAAEWSRPLKYRGEKVYKRLLTLALLMGAVLIVFAACSDDSEDTAPAVPERASPPIPPAPAPAAQTSAPAPSAPAVAGTAVSVGLNDAGGRGPFEFSSTDFNFKNGEVVNFSFTSDAQFHTFTVAELGIDVAVDGGDTVNFDFTFDKPGVYTLICIPHEALGMVGTITVEDGAAPAPAAAPVPAAAATSVSSDLNDGDGRGPFEFAPVNYEFSVGESVNFAFVAQSQFHTFTVNDLGIDVAVDGGKTVDFSHTFDKAGTYKLICIPHEALGMTGTITVK